MTDWLEIQLYILLGAGMLTLYALLLLWGITRQQSKSQFFHRGKSMAEYEAMLMVQRMRGIPEGTDWNKTRKMIPDHPVKLELAKQLMEGMSEEQRAALIKEAEEEIAKIKGGEVEEQE